jgi:hypothetical protein
LPRRTERRVEYGQKGAKAQCPRAASGTSVQRRGKQAASSVLVFQHTRFLNRCFAFSVGVLLSSKLKNIFVKRHDPTRSKERRLETQTSISSFVCKGFH